MPPSAVARLLLSVVCAVVVASVEGQEGQHCPNGLGACAFEDAGFIQSKVQTRDTTCGAGGGEHCGAAFSKFTCPGTCCHDAFDTWCCPVGPWKCNGDVQSSFHESFQFHGNSHCNRDDLCVRTDDDLKVTKAEPAGEPTIKSAPAWSGRGVPEVIKRVVVKPGEHLTMKGTGKDKNEVIEHMVAEHGSHVTFS